MKNPFKRTQQDVATDVTTQVTQAQRLAGIGDQELLADPSTNPATRSRADHLRVQQHLAALDQQHRRSLRTGRVRDARAAAAERTLEAITIARETTSSGRAVGSLSLTRGRIVTACLVFSILLSIGSGMAIDTWLQSLEKDQQQGLGYIVEAGLTVLATSMIVLRGLLAARETKLAPWQTKAFAVLIVAPLIASAILATMGSPVGAFCSVGAAAWSVAAYLASTSLSTAISDALAKVKGEDEDELRRIALDQDDEHPEPPQARTPDQWVTDQTDLTVTQLEEFLADQDGPDTGGLSQGHTGPDTNGPTPRTGGAPTREEVQAAWARQQELNRGRIGGHIDSDQHERNDQPGQGQTGVTAATRARSLAGAQTRDRIAAHLSRYPADTQAQIAAAVGVSESTVKRHLRALRGGDAR